MLIALWKYKFFILNSIKNDLTNNFKRSSIGSLWIILNPLSQVLIYSLILSKIISAKLPNSSNEYGYSIYLMAGLLCWNHFQGILTRSTNIFIDNSNYLKKMQFPRTTIPAILYGSEVLNSFLLFVAIIFIALILQYPLNIGVLLVIPFMILLLGLFTISIGILLGVINVFIRDISQLLAIVIQLLFWFTPIVYPETIVPSYLLKLLKINPMYHFVKIYQNMICLGEFPNFIIFLLLILLTTLALVFAIKFYKNSIDEIIDAI